MQQLFWVGIGGAVGSILRYLGQRWLNMVHFPFGTFTVNIAGCLLIGILCGLFAKGSISDTTRLLLITGFCGGFTTFSSFSAESVQMLTENRWLSFAIYISASVAAGVLATFAGYKLTS